MVLVKAKNRRKVKEKVEQGFPDETYDNAFLIKKHLLKKPLKHIL
ncbi:hypothetical protein Q9253_13555 [Bacillus safensis]|nr:hypothetical protein [Bacillus safensis]MDP4566405.1 hypothetical protein [Bacillus safensis]